MLVKGVTGAPSLKIGGGVANTTGVTDAGCMPVVAVCMEGVLLVSSASSPQAAIAISVNRQTVSDRRTKVRGLGMLELVHGAVSSRPHERVKTSADDVPPPEFF